MVNRQLNEFVADIHEFLMTRSALASVNGVPWDMHRPLVENCEISFLHFQDENPIAVNKVCFCNFLFNVLEYNTQLTQGK